MKPKTKLPRARVMHTELPQLFTAIPQVFHQKPMPKGSYTVGFPVLVLPMPSLKSARQRAKWENLSEGEKVQKIRQFFVQNGTMSYTEMAQGCLAVMEGRT